MKTVKNLQPFLFYLSYMTSRIHHPLTRSIFIILPLLDLFILHLKIYIYIYIYITPFKGGVPHPSLNLRTPKRTEKLKMAPPRNLHDGAIFSLSREDSGAKYQIEQHHSIENQKSHLSV